MIDDSGEFVPGPSDGYQSAEKEDPDARPTPIAVDPDGIASELISYPHWICWRFEWKDGRGDDGEWSKIPINPTTGKNARANDPNATAGSFEDALNYHERDDTDTDGLGFVLSDSPFSGVDLDGLYNPETGEWAETGREIIDTLESYSEFSPSGRGGHILMIGDFPDGGRKNDPVEMYDSGRYFTVTGQQIPDTSGTIPAREDGEERLEDVHRMAFPDDYADDDTDGDGDEIPPDAPSSSTPGTSHLDDEELIAKAQSAENGEKFSRLWNGSTAGYDSNSEADLALCNLLAFWTAGDREKMDELFRESGLMRGKWDEDCTAEDDTYGEHTMEKALAKTDTYYDPHYNTDIPYDTDGNGADDGTKPPADFDVKDGGYGVHIEKTNEEGETYYIWEEWTNFTIGLNSIVTTPDGDKEMALTIYPRDEDPYDVSVDPTVLNETRSFKKEVCIGATTTFDGGPSNLAKIKQYVGSQDAPRKIGTDHMGLHTKGDRSVWVTPDGNLDAEGWVDETEIAYLKTDITAERKWDVSPDDGTDPDHEAVREILELLPQVRERARMLPLLGWFYASAVRPLIMEWEGQFNFVSVTGETGAGKTTTIETLWELFGMEGEPLTPKTTETSLLTTFSTSQSVPMWYDEYKPSDLSQQEVNRFHEKLRMSTRGQVDQRSNVDLSDDTYRLQAPTVVSGEERIQGSAEERRGIFTSFKYATRQPGTQTALANAKLTGRSTADPTDFTKSVVFDGFDFKHHAIAYIMWVCDQDHDELYDMWHAADEWARDVIGSKGVTGLDDLELQGLQTVRFGCELFRAFHESVGGDGEVITDDDVEEAIEFIVNGGGGDADRRTHLNVMLDVASRAASEGYLEEDSHYTFVRKGSDTEELRINLNTSFDKVKKYAKDHDVSGDLLNNKSDYDERLRNEEDTLDWLACRSQQSPPVGSSIGIKTDVAEAQIDGFGRWMWDSEVEGSTEEEWKPLNNSAEGRINLTFEVTYRTTDVSDKKAEEGTISDSTKSVDYVIWASEADKVPALEEGKCYSARGVKKGSYDGAPQYQFDAGVRELTEVEKGFGHIESADSGMNTSLDAAATDGGEIDQLAGKVYETVSQHGPVEKGVLTGMVAATNPDYEINEIENAIEMARSRGKIEDFGDGLETL